MRAIAPRTGAPEDTLGEDQDECYPITVAGYQYQHAVLLLTRWTFTDEERRRVAKGEDIYIAQMNYGGEPMIRFVVQCGPDGFLIPEADS